MIPVTLNTFDDEGNVVVSTTQDLTSDQVSDIIDHAAQLVLTANTVDDFDSDDFRNVLSELSSALESADII